MVHCKDDGYILFNSKVINCYVAKSNKMSYSFGDNPVYIFWMFTDDEFPKNEQLKNKKININDLRHKKTYCGEVYTVEFLTSRYGYHIITMELVVSRIIDDNKQTDIELLEVSYAKA